MKNTMQTFKIILITFIIYLFTNSPFPVLDKLQLSKVYSQTPPVSLSFDPDKLERSPNQAFDIDIFLTTPNFSYDISSFNLTITYDKNVIQIEDVEQTTQYNSALKMDIDNNNGRVTYARANTTKVDITGKIYLGSITFRAKSRGTSTIQFTNAKITASRHLDALPTTLRTASVTVSTIEGDANADGKVDILDYNIIVSCFGEKIDSSACTNKDSADVNGDGTVDGVDYNIFLRALRQ